MARYPSLPCCRPESQIGYGEAAYYSLFRQGRMLYELMPNMTDSFLLP